MCRRYVVRGLLLLAPCSLLLAPSSLLLARGGEAKTFMEIGGRVATILDGTAPGTPDPPVSPLRADESWWAPLLEVEVKRGVQLL
jgi:hypothetical protein